jgi:hypothetical protein
MDAAGQSPECADVQAGAAEADPGFMESQVIGYRLASLACLRKPFQQCLLPNSAIHFDSS